MIIKINGNINELLSRIDKQPTPPEIDQALVDQFFSSITDYTQVPGEHSPMMIDLLDRLNYQCFEFVGAERVYKGASFTVGKIAEAVGIL